MARLQLAIVNAHTDLPLTFYLLHIQIYDEMIYEIDHKLNCQHEIKLAMILAVMNAIFAIA